MYILIISGGCPFGNTPLGGIFEFDQAKALQALGNKVIFVSLDLRSLRRWRKWGKQYFVKEGVEIYNISIPLGRVPAQCFCFFGRLGLDNIYQDILKEHGIPNVVHAHFTSIAAIANIFKTKYHLPYVITEHSSALNEDFLTPSTIYYAKNSYPFADKIVAVSSTLANNIFKYFGLSCDVIHNIVSSEFKNDQVITKKKEGFSFISVGNLIYRKGFDLLIKAFSEANLPENVTLNIIGGGGLQTDLQQLIAKLNMANRIHLLGYKNREEIAKIMTISDVFVLASRCETFGVVYIEAMLSGLPVIATMCGGPEDFVTSENGILIPINDVNLLKRAMEQIYHNTYDKREISENCYRYFSSYFIGTQIVNLYKNLLK